MGMWLGGECAEDDMFGKAIEAQRHSLEVVDEGVDLIGVHGAVETLEFQLPHRQSAGKRVLFYRP